MLLDQINVAPEAVRIIVGNAVIPDLIKSAPNAEQVAPGCLFAGIPEFTPLLLAVGGGMQIGVAGMEVLRSLHSLRIVNPL